MVKVGRFGGKETVIKRRKAKKKKLNKIKKGRFILKNLDQVEEKQEGRLI